MATWFEKLLRQRGTSTRPEPALTPVAPYEHIVEAEPPVDRHVHRPLVYAFEHMALPRAFFTAHPMLREALGTRQTLGREFLHFWSMSATICCSSYGWTLDEDEEIERFWDYARPLMDLVVCVPTITEDYFIWTIRTPKPVSVNETYFLALARPNRPDLDPESLTDLGRYFTLEASIEPESACFCEWSIENQHLNYGEASLQTSDGFTQQVLGKLRQAGA